MPVTSGEGNPWQQISFDGASGGFKDISRLLGRFEALRAVGLSSFAWAEWASAYRIYSQFPSPPYVIEGGPTVHDILGYS